MGAWIEGLNFIDIYIYIYIKIENTKNTKKCTITPPICQSFGIFSPTKISGIQTQGKVQRKREETKKQRGGKKGKEIKKNWKRRERAREREREKNEFNFDINIEYLHESSLLTT